MVFYFGMLKTGLEPPRRIALGQDADVDVRVVSEVKESSVAIFYRFYINILSYF